MMNRTLRSFLCPFGFIVMLTGVCSGAFAKDYFREFDQNEDGLLSGTEARYLNSLDSDKDGDITPEEFVSELVKHATEDSRNKLEGRFTELDINEDGRLSGTEARGREELDTNQDGRISREEFLADVKPVVIAPRFRTMSGPELVQEAFNEFQALDENNDRTLSGEEAAGFENFDGNKDGQVSLEEFVPAILIWTMASALNQPDVVEVSGKEFLNALATAIARQDPQFLWDRMGWTAYSRPDQPLVKYIILLTSKELGALQSPEQDAAVLDPATGRLERTLLFEKGSLVLSALPTVQELRDVEISGELMNRVDEILFPDMFSGVLLRGGFFDEFIESYSPMVSRTLVAALQGEVNLSACLVDDTHTEDDWVQKFTDLHGAVGTCLECQLSKWSADWDPKGKSGSFSLTCEVVGPLGVFEVHAELERKGLEFWISKVTYKRTGNFAPFKIDPPQDWVTTTVEEGVSVTMPGQPVREVYEDGEVGYAVENLDVQSRLSVFLNEFPEGTAVNATEELQRWLDPKLTNDEAEFVEAMPGYWRGYPGQVALFRIGENRMAIRRDIIVGSKRCSLLWYSENPTFDMRLGVGLPFLTSLQLSEKYLGDAQPTVQVEAESPGK